MKIKLLKKIRKKYKIVKSNNRFALYKKIFGLIWIRIDNSELTWDYNNGHIEYDELLKLVNISKL